FEEKDSPISRVMEGNARISLVEAENTALWGLLSRIEPWNDGSNGVLREYFAWEDSCLVIRRENLIYEGISFPRQEEAEQYARETDIPENQILSIPMVNTRVRVESAGREHYFETPLKIHSAAPVFIGGVKLGFSGEFALKAVSGQLVLTQILPLEEYIAGVIQNEIGNSAPPEALKAQAVTARTHAVSLLLYNRHKDNGYDLCNTTHCQVYKGKHLLNADILEAVEATRGEILVCEGRVADATYHSACGGKTDSSANIWHGAPLTHLSGVTCIESATGFDLSRESQARRWIETSIPTDGMSSWEKASLSWQKSISQKALAKNVGLARIDRIVINKRGNSGRITDITFHGSGSARLTSEYQIRRAFGSAKSSFFYIRGAYSLAQNGGVVIHPQGTVTIKGRGSGHGVGMCQVGTLRRARQGGGYQDILRHYYPGTNITADWRGNGTQ
ncbi:MAG: SpoIID/LytB domain-containing protein, partial [Candidatus Syntrophosphaera sp.]